MDDYPVSVLDRIQNSNDNLLWEDRIALQSLWTLQEKGWKTAVEWKETAHGIGVFAAEFIEAGTVLRIGHNGRNLFQFRTIDDIDAFCGVKGNQEYEGRLAYVKDYLWGFSTQGTDHRGYNVGSNQADVTDEHTRFFGMWLPGNGLNHHSSPNTVYRAFAEGTDQGIELVALTDISNGDELVDDYRRHGIAPAWLLEFARRHAVTLNFADCNTFVEGLDSTRGVT